MATPPLLPWAARPEAQQRAPAPGNHQRVPARPRTPTNTLETAAKPYPEALAAARPRFAPSQSQWSSSTTTAACLLGRRINTALSASSLRRTTGLVRSHPLNRSLAPPKEPRSTTAARIGRSERFGRTIRQPVKFHRPWPAGLQPRPIHPAGYFGGSTSSLDRASRALPNDARSRSARAASNLPIGFQTILAQAIAFVVTP